MRFSSQIVFLLSCATTINAFVNVGPSSSAAFICKQRVTNDFISSQFSNVNNNKLSISNGRPLYAEEGGEGGESAADAEEESAADASEEEKEAAKEEEEGEEEAPKEEEEKEEEEDPAVTELKAEIKKYESMLWVKKETLKTLEDTANEFTEEGYARRVAEMEGVKRVRMNMASSKEDTALASVIQNFLPVWDKLTALDEANKDTKIGEQFGGGLTSSMATAMKELGVSEFTFKPGDAVDMRRMIITEERHSDEFPKDTVIRPLSLVGREINGNIMQMVDVVASLGKEVVEEEEEEKEEGEEAAAEGGEEQGEAAEEKGEEASSE